MADARTERRLAALEAQTAQWPEIRESLKAVESKLGEMRVEWKAAKLSGRILLAVGAAVGGLVTWVLNRLLSR